MEKTKKTLKRFLCVVSRFSLFYMMHFKKYQKGIKTCFFFFFLQKKVNLTKKKKGKTEGLESAVCVVGTPGLLIHNSQFKTVQIDTDYRHMICLGFAPVHIEFFFFFFSSSAPPSTDGLHDTVAAGLVG